MLSGCSLWNKYFSKDSAQESRITEQEAVKASSGAATVDQERGLGVSDGTKKETTVIQQNPIRPQKNEILIKYRNKSSEVILSLDPRDNNVQIDVSKANPGGETANNLEANSDFSYDVGQENDDSGETESDLLAQAQNKFYSGDYQAALNLINSSLGKRPTARAYALKGSIYYMLGNLALARKNWVNSLRLNSNVQGVRQMLNKIGY